MRERSESELVQLAVGSDVAAFTELVQRHDRLLRAYAYRFLACDFALMEDVLQDAYLKAFRNLSRFRGESAFGTWLHRIVHNSCVDAIRRRRDTTTAELTLDSGVDHVESLVTRVDVTNALRRLPAIQRGVVLLIDIHGFDYRNAATVLGIPVGTVRSRLARARETLRKALRESS